MKIPWTLVAVLATATLMAAPKPTALLPDASLTEMRWTADTEEEIKERLQQINLPFEARFTPEVRSLIKEYLTYGYKDTEAMLGRANLYFPIFDHYLGLRDLPRELKFLPMVESAMRPNARSYVGAAGLWQFMDFTARQYQLRINNYVDDRQDPYRSTEAATQMLADLYAMYGDWSLVLAAYNCGPGRVNRAIREAGSSNYWTLQAFLPAETQKYVPAFIAAAYVGTFYKLHNLAPRFPQTDFLETRVVKVYDYLTFRDIAHITQIEVAKLESLNPGFLQRVVPKSSQGNYLVLPVSALPAFRSFLAERSSTAGKSQLEGHDDYFKTTYVVAAGDNLQNLARLFHCSVDEIMEWNGLQSEEVVVNQELELYLTKEYLLKRV